MAHNLINPASSHDIKMDLSLEQRIQLTESLCHERTTRGWLTEQFWPFGSGNDQMYNCLSSSRPKDDQIVLIPEK